MRATLFLLLLFAARADAGLIGNVDRDTPTSAQVTWLWDGAAPADNSVTLPNWRGSYELSIFTQQDSDLFALLRIEHGADPIRDGNVIIPGGIFAPLLVLSEPGSVGTLIDYHFPILDARYHFIFDRAPNPADSTIRLAMQRVPVPATLHLLLAGIVVFSLLPGRSHAQST